MKVDFNNLRMQIAYSLDDLIKTLNNGKLDGNEHVLLDNGKWKIGNILVDDEDLRGSINELRSLVYGLICCYQEDDNECIDLTEKLKQNGGIAKFFNEEEI